MRAKESLWKSCLLLVMALVAGQAGGQVDYAIGRPLASNVIVPQSRSAAAGRTTVEVTEVNVGVVIIEQAATTTMDISLRNPTERRIEAELAVPVPDGAVVRSFAFHGAASEPSAELLPKSEASKTYEAIVAKVRDPALLEFIGYNLIRSSVFPVEAKGTQKVRLTYEHLLPADGNRIDYMLPRTESLDYSVPWKVSVRIKSKTPVSTVYSHSHRLETTRVSENVVSARIADDAATQPGPFRLSYLLEGDGVTASLFAYPDPKIGGGYFLLLAGLPATPRVCTETPAIKREVTLVLDRSGSMSGEKIEQVREAAFQVLGGLEEGEAFSIIAYNDVVEPFSKEPLFKTEKNIEAARAYLKSITARGGTNIHDALLEALRQKPAEGMLPIVLFLTDGLPTVGQTSEAAIRDVAIKANPYERRIFTFGVGVDVNTPLLDKIASETRATATFVLPKEDVEVKVAQVFKRLAGPVLAEPSLQVTGAPIKWASAQPEPLTRPRPSTAKLASVVSFEGSGRAATGGTRDPKTVANLFHSVLEEKVEVNYATKEGTPIFTWSDIPVLLKLAESERSLTSVPSRLISSYSQRRGREGMVALWLIEGLRMREEQLLEKEQTRKIFPRITGLWPPLNPMCAKEGMKLAECEDSAQIHREALEAYRKWWGMVESLPPNQAAVFDPLDLTDLVWCGGSAKGEIEMYGTISSDGIVARRIKNNYEGVVVKTVHYMVDEQKLPAEQWSTVVADRLFDKSVLAPQKVILPYYDDQGKEIRQEEYLPPRPKSNGSTLAPASRVERATSEPVDLRTRFTRVRDVIPAKLPDLFEGDQLVVLGQYVGNEPLGFQLSGNYLGKRRTFQFTFGLDNATTRNAFVPRLWASRKIGVLVDAVRQLGAGGGALPSSRAVSEDPRLKELVNEIVSLSTQFGILTEYTAFLAQEGTDLTRRDEVLAEANRNFFSRAVATRTGLGSVNQSLNNDFQLRQDVLNYRNTYFDQNMDRVTLATVQQMNDMAFYRRGNRWVDSRVVEKEHETEPKKAVKFGSGEFRKLAERLAEQNRQGAISLDGDILMVVDGETILVEGSAE